MRCALQYNEKKELAMQKVKAWGEMQSLEDEPSYKEEDLTEESRTWFHGFKCAIDYAINDLKYNMFMSEPCGFVQDEIDREVRILIGEVAMMLFVLIDEQIDE